MNKRSKSVSEVLKELLRHDVCLLMTISQSHAYCSTVAGLGVGFRAWGNGRLKNDGAHTGAFLLSFLSFF